MGIGEEDLGKVFDKFYRSSDDKVLQKSGHGLGLPLAQQIVHMHHGSLVLTSKLGEGSTFTIRLEKDAKTMLQAETE